MMYRDTLIEHWRNLYSDFAQEYDRLKAWGNEPNCFERWYETRIHRWQSVAYPEGMILEQVDNSEFAQELTDVMKAFRFEYIEPKAAKPIWYGIVLGLAAGIVSAVFLALLHWETVRIILSGIVVFIVAALGFVRSEESAKNNELKRVKEAYIDQLKEYSEKLTAVCDKFEVD